MGAGVTECRKIKGKEGTKVRIFIANVGARDLQIKINNRLYRLDVRLQPQEAEEIKSSLSGFFGKAPSQLGVRALGQWLLEQKKCKPKNFQKFLKTAVACPILKPALDLALTETKTLDVVYLLGTDQLESAPSPLRENDTYWAAQIIQQWLCQCYQKQKKLNQVHVLRVGDIVPARWDEAYRLIARLKVATGEEQEVELRELLQKSQVVFAEISGGIPALNFALHQVVLNVCGRKTRIIQVLEQPGTSQAHLLDIQVFWGDRLIRQLDMLLKSYDYKAALDLLKDEIPEDQREEHVQKAIAALHHADARLNFDFQRALEAIKDYKSEEPFQSWYNSANHQIFADRVREALGCLEIFRRSHQLIAFIALADGIVEGLTRLAAETLMPELQGIYCDEKGQKISDPFKPRRYVPLRKLQIDLQNHLRQYLQNQRRQVPKHGRLLADELFYSGVIAYHITQNSKDAMSVNTVIDQLRACMSVNTVIGQLRACLNGFRNDLLHNLANLSEDALRAKIEEHLKEDTLSGVVKKMKNVFECVKKMKNVFECVNALSSISPAIAPRINEQLKKVVEEVSQQSSTEGEKLVFDEINQFVLQTLSEAWGVPLPPRV
jgi:hypothetical protein